ncbi:MAG TPA: type ISP restriction/modification enzyme [Chitinophagaceae bacterium]|nr:type ISP restriction/modification enzyme [Chitinophagaceae bacterium]
MSIYAIQQYHKELEKIIHYGGSKKETAIRNAFYYLLNEYAHSKDLMLIAEISTKNKAGKIITPDGTIKDSIRNDWGYWESKDESDDINDEIRNKFNKGYPSDNILFEDSQTAVLYQHGDEVMRRNMLDEEQLHEVLTKFLNYERPEVHDFREAIEHFKQDIPKVTVAIRDIIDAQQKTNAELQKAQEGFLAMAKVSINPDINEDDVKEMMIQHILSADIFNTIFDEPHFHQENNIARELNKVIDTFFTGNVRRQTLGQIKHYYDTINARAASIADHHEKQKFLKVVYENFYKGYNPKAADRLGIVYTPNEIVQFMIRSTDYLLHKHFGKTLGDKNVEILDPATGTGTFITDIIDYLPKAKLKQKYKNELHANEVAILPYYIANLNIEYTYKQKMGEYEQFDNLCFVDTLDNTGFHWVGKQGDLFGVTAENAQRIKRQNERRISVVIGNPPYNANQQNENDNNKNRAYTEIDKRIKETFIKNSTAQKTKMYDMYSRFYRWAMDRLNDNGVIAFISNRSFIDSRTFDGFRKTVQEDFDHIYIVDTKSDVRANPKISGTAHNVFGIQAGVAVLFLVKSTHKKLKTDPCKIEYVAMDDYWKKEEKLAWFSQHELNNIEFENITPDKNNNWLTNDEFDELIPLADKAVKTSQSEEAIFKLFCWGNSSNRDEWVYDFNNDTLEKKMVYFSETFNRFLKSREENLPNSIKWSSDLKSKLSNSNGFTYDSNKSIIAFWRPFTKQFFYSEKIINDRLTDNHYQIFGPKLNRENLLLMITNHPQTEFLIHAVDKMADAGYGSRGTQMFPLYRYDEYGNKLDNITDWSLELFQKNYADKTITKESIFHYVYAVLHHPPYRKKYELNLKREFPRIPFYDNFYQWVIWGEQLMNLHIGYETGEPYPLNVIARRNDEAISDGNSTKSKAPRNDVRTPKAKLKALKDTGVIVLDDNTELHGVPKEAWEYKLGNRSALEWILDQYKEKKPTDPTIAEKFNTYKFADYKEQVIDLLKRVCTVSVETMKIVKEIPQQ